MALLNTSSVPTLTFKTKFTVPKFVTLSADLSQIKFAYNDTNLKYVVKKRHKKYNVYLCGKLDFLIQFATFVASSTVPVANSDWPLVYKNCKKVRKLICCLDTKPTNLNKNIQTAPGFRGFIDTPINPVLSSVQQIKDHLCIKIVTNLTQCADFFAPIILTGAVRCTCPALPSAVVSIIDQLTGAVIVSNLPLDNFLNFTTPPIPAGAYVIQYACASDPSIILTRQSDFYHLSGTVPTVRVNCLVCPP